MDGAKTTVISGRDFSDLISPDESQLKFDEMEQEMLDTVKALASEEYGIEVSALGIKRIGPPTSVTSQVFTRMIQERQVLISQFRGEGQSRAAEIRAEADRKSQEIIAEANGQARRIEGKADEEAAAAYSVFAQNEELALLILEHRVDLTLGQFQESGALFSVLHHRPAKTWKGQLKRNSQKIMTPWHKDPPQLRAKRKKEGYINGPKSSGP